ncbi:MULTISPECIES: glycosyltransferase [unclassified Sphingobacterium]|uniref:glycosyltransferase n=1 Tax=unclassified Sphingobacterium TaxID=2609468 RepID=UPI0025CDB3C7|nr:MULTISPECIES: glycosyltransferase [unclassified Sphingobacterium]
MNKPLISVIVPIYNVEEFLPICIDSILAQTYERMEIILVDDGSPDGCGAICDEYADKDNRIVVIHKENGGLSDARNAGLEVAKGEYIWFVDSDDYILCDCLEDFMSEIHKNSLDLLSFGFQRVTAEGRTLPTKINYNTNTFIIDGVELLNNYTVISNAWMYIYKKEIIDNNNIRFIKGIYHEDEAFTTIYISYVQKYKHLGDAVAYAYLSRPESIINTSDYNKKVKRLVDMVVVVDAINLIRIKTSGLLYRGLSRKSEQLLISIFLRMKNEKIKREDMENIVNKLKDIGLYPLAIKSERLKFRILGRLLNNRFFLKIFHH